MSENLPIILIELVLVFGGVLLFVWWQLRSVKRDQRQAAREAADARAAAERGDDAGTPPQ